MSNGTHNLHQHQDFWNAADEAFGEGVAGQMYESLADHPDPDIHLLRFIDEVTQIATARARDATPVVGDEELPNMVDIPLAWEVIGATKPENHHPKCSYQQGMLCDCALNDGLIYLSGKFRSLAARAVRVPDEPVCTYPAANWDDFRSDLKDYLARYSDKLSNLDRAIALDDIYMLAESYFGQSEAKGGQGE